jgi:bacterial/archaeal transporter family protein
MLGTERITLKYLHSFKSIPVASMFFLIASIFLLPVFFTLSPNELRLNSSELFLILLSSTLYSIGFFSYVKAISVGDTSLVAPLYNSSLLWLLFLGYFILGDNVTLIRIFGGLLMFLGFFFLFPGSLKNKFLALVNSSASKYMIVGSIFVSLGRTIDAFTTGEVNPYINVNQSYYAFLINFVVGLMLLMATFTFRQQNDLVNLLVQKPRIIVFAGFLNGWAYLCLLWAIKYLQVSVAEPASLLSVFVTAFFAKHILKENVEQRLPGMIIMVIGAIFLTLSV